MPPEGVHVVSLGNFEFEGKNSAYILDRDGLALVDPGAQQHDVREELQSQLEQRGHSISDVDDVLLTHFHMDHAGIAAEIQEESGAAVHVHEGDAPLVRGDQEAHKAMHTRQMQLFDDWAIPTEKIDSIPAINDDASETESTVVPAPESVTAVQDGEMLSAGGFELEVVAAPGHTVGQCCYEFESLYGLEAFVGDAVLPEYTPNVGGSDGRVEDPLETYLNSLSRLRSREYDRLWPGHRDVITEPNGRIDEIIEHHRERSKRILSFLQEEGPADVWSTSAHLFGELEGVHIIHGPGEAYAHLDYLRKAGILTRTPDGYRLRHQPDTSLDELLA